MACLNKIKQFDEADEVNIGYDTFNWITATTMKAPFVIEQRHLKLSLFVVTLRNTQVWIVVVIAVDVKFRIVVTNGFIVSANCPDTLDIICINTQINCLNLISFKSLGESTINVILHMKIEKVVPTQPYQPKRGTFPLNYNFEFISMNLVACLFFFDILHTLHSSNRIQMCSRRKFTIPLIRLETQCKLGTKCE